MNINRSNAVEIFKQHGRLWYYAAQKLPIESYKDIILLYEFCYQIMSLTSLPDAKEQISLTIQNRHKAFREKSINNTEFGGLIDILLRNNLTEQPIKDFFQSVLLYTKNMNYQNYDELKVYIGGIAEGIGSMVADIMGCAPPGYPYAQAMGESMRLIHMLLDVSQDHNNGRNYFPLTDMKKYGVSEEDIATAVATRICGSNLRDLIKYYVDEHEQLSSYAVQGIGYINKTGHVGVSDLITMYEEYVLQIQHYQYNIFHPRFQSGIKAKLLGYPIYWYNNLLGNTA